MPEGKTINYVQGEYPELSGLETGAPVELRIKAHVETEDGENGSLVFDEVVISTENQADRALTAQTKQSYQDKSTSTTLGDEF